MNKRVLYHKKTGEAVQVIAQAQTKPNFQDVVCYQELTSPYEYYVMEKMSFFSIYTRAFDELPEKNTKQIEKRADLPDMREARQQMKREKVEHAGSKEPIEMEGPIGMGGPIAMGGPTESGDPMQAKMMEFFDARTYVDRIRIFEDMREANDHILTNIAVSMDIALEDGIDIYDRILSELRMRKRYEVTDRRPE